MDTNRVLNILAVQFVVIVVLCGGSSRYDSLAQIPVRLSALLLIGWVLVATKRPHVWNRQLITMFGLFAALCVAQLIPLPAEIWFQLPGRSDFVNAVRSAGVSQFWRPVNFLPDMGLNTLFAMIPPLAVMAFWSIRAKANVRADAIGVILIAFASAVLGLLQVLSGDDSPLRAYEITSRDSAVGFFANRNHQALLLACSVPLLGLVGSTSNSASGKGKIELLVIAALVAFQLVMILATGSRAGLLWAGIGFCSAAFFLREHLWFAATQASTKAKYAFFALSAVFVALVFAVSRSPIAIAIDRIFQSETSIEVRYQIWPTLADMFWAFFPYGSGFGSFARLYRRFETSDALEMTYLNHAHNDLYELAIEGGLPAILIVLIFAVWWGFQCWRAVAKNSLLAQAGMSVGSMILASSLVDYPLRTPLFACFMTGICLWMADRKQNDRR